MLSTLSVLVTRPEEQYPANVHPLAIGSKRAKGSERENKKDNEQSTDTSKYLVVGVIEYRSLRLKLANSLDEETVLMLAETLGAEIGKLILCLQVLGTDSALFNQFLRN